MPDDSSCSSPHAGSCEFASWGDGPRVCVVPLRAAPVNPRTEADAQIAGALQIVVDAGGDHDRAPVGREDEYGRRDYTPEELDALFFALGMAAVQLKKLPGGREAHDRAIASREAELARRGVNVVSKIEPHERAAALVRRTFGDDVDLGYGTTGYHLAKVVEAELRRADGLREQLLKLAAEFRQG